MSPVSHQPSSSFLHPSLSGGATSSTHSSASVLGSYATEDPLETRVANISMEIAAAIAQGQAEDRSQQERELSEDALESEEAEDTETGGNRREQEDNGTVYEPGEEFEVAGGEEEDFEGEAEEDSEGGGEAFPEPLRKRKDRTVGSKRKRH